MGFELKKKYSLKKHWLWILGAFAVGVIGDRVSEYCYGVGGNFFLHASGGSAATLLYFYLTRTLKLSFNWRLNLAFIFGFVSALGVVNEVAEYALELSGYGKYSYDTHDVWRDFTANTTGMAITWLAIMLVTIALKEIRKEN